MNRRREIRSPDVYSVYRVPKSFGNKIEISHTINSDTCARNPHLLKTEVVLHDLKQNQSAGLKLLGLLQHV